MLEGQSVQLACECHGIPLPSLSWWKDGRALFLSLTSAHMGSPSCWSPWSKERFLLSSIQLWLGICPAGSLRESCCPFPGQVSPSPPRQGAQSWCPQEGTWCTWRRSSCWTRGRTCASAGTLLAAAARSIACRCTVSVGDQRPVGVGGGAVTSLHASWTQKPLPGALDILEGMLVPGSALPLHLCTAEGIAAHPLHPVSLCLQHCQGSRAAATP